MSTRLFWHIGWLLLWVSLSSPALRVIAAPLAANPELGLGAPPGFRVSLYADSSLANDIYAMTLDSDGNVVVTGRGYIRTLYDTNGDGIADASTEFGRTVSGGMGMCFEGRDLYFVGDGGLWRYRDGNGDGVADQAPQRIRQGAGGEHGIHGLRKGPDGWWYWMGGNDAGFGPNLASLGSSPIRRPEGGALIRLSPGFESSEIIAHGFRNAYDFDFNEAGDLFTYDSDVEADYLLPWYSPTRVYHIGHGDHHGWRLNGWRRSWSRPPYNVDTVELAVSLGRGSPTGVSGYQHYQFPPYFRNGLFVADWTFGRVVFLRLSEDGPSYAAEPEPFLTALGSQGFAPTDIEVGTEGSLYVSIGGRGTRGGVYRVEYVGDPSMSSLARNWRAAALTEFWAVLDAPQPLSAWSRAYWEPLARRIGAAPFDAVVMDEVAPAQRRLRAVEILTEIHGGLATRTAEVGARSPSAVVRARVAWSLGRVPCAGFGPILLALTRDSHPMVRRFAMDGAGDRANDLDLLTLQSAITANIAHPDERLRRASARLASRLPDSAWGSRWEQSLSGDYQTRLTATLALLWREAPGSISATSALAVASVVLKESNNLDQRLQAVRMMILALGDWRLDNPPVELFTGYAALATDPALITLAEKSASDLKAVIGSGLGVLDVEAARLLAMLESSDPGVAEKVLGLVTAGSFFSLDFHYLTVFSRLKAKVTAAQTAQVADAFLSLERKLAGQGSRNRQNWTPRLLELWAALVEKDPELVDAILAHPWFPVPGHLPLAAGLGARRVEAARVFFEAAKLNPLLDWSAELVELLSILPSEEVLPLFRARWTDESLRGVLLPHLARQPVQGDLAKYVWGISSKNAEVVETSLMALQGLAPDTSGRALGAAVLALDELLDKPGEQRARARVLEFIRWQTKLKFPVQEKGGDRNSLRLAYQVVFDWVDRHEPELSRGLKARRKAEVSWSARLRRVNWAVGDAVRGEAVYRQRGCAGCHSGVTALGPDLRGVTRRFSPPALMESILFPGRQVAEPYRMTTFHLKSGGLVTGSIAYESAEGVILRTGVASTIRLNAQAIARREVGEQSLMPEGLLDGLGPGQLADLHAYLAAMR